MIVFRLLIFDKFGDILREDTITKEEASHPDREDFFSDLYSFVVGNNLYGIGPKDR